VGDVDEEGRVRLYEPWELGAATGEAKMAGSRGEKRA
jgi:hypothetical protein